MWQRAFSTLHSTLLSGCGSPVMMRIWMDLDDRIERYINLFADFALDLVLDHHSKHREIVDAATKRDRTRLHKLVNEMFEMGTKFRQTVYNTLKSYEKRMAGDPAPGAEGSSRKRGRPPKR